jgi:hypothetical protein
MRAACSVHAHWPPDAVEQIATGTSTPVSLPAERRSEIGAHGGGAAFHSHTAQAVVFEAGI